MFGGAPKIKFDKDLYERVKKIAEMAGDKAIVISTHILEEVEAICTRAVIIARCPLTVTVAVGSLTNPVTVIELTPTTLPSEGLVISRAGNRTGAKD